MPSCPSKGITITEAPMLTRRFALSATLLAVACGCAAPSLRSAEPPVPGQQAVAQANAPVPVTRVVLFSSGVGYMEHAGKVTGTTSSELSFKTAQINDALKSLVVEDRDGGQVTTIAYPSQDPIAKTLRSFQVDISGNPTFGDLLGQLRGAKVKVRLGDTSLSGIILGVERRVKVVGDRGDKIDEWVLNLIDGATVRAIELGEVRSLDFEDPTLQAELGKALAALAQARDQDKKPMLIHFVGQGERRVRIGYIVEAPVWKTSYRLLLDQAAGAKSKLQGWAIVENQTDNDWNKVSLTLVSGQPISFIQNLYQPLYIPRPVVEPELFASLRPQLYGDGLGKSADQPAVFAERKMAKQRQSMAAPSAPSPSVAAGAMAMEAAAEAGEPLDAAQGVQSLAQAEKLGEFFQYTVPDVDLPRQRSAMIPIVTDDITAERLSIYNRTVLAKHPLLGAKLINSTGKHLQAGPVTVLDQGGYTGDARIDNLPPGQERLLSFAIDLEMTVQAEGKGTTNTLLTGRLVNGVLEIKRRYVQTQEYLVANKADSPRSLIIEHPLTSGWTLVDTPTPEETTDTLYRFRDTVEAGKSSSLVVKEERTDFEGVALVDADLGLMDFYIQAKEIPAGVREALGKAMTLKRSLEELNRQIGERQQKIEEVTREQQRIRENMRTVDQKSEYYKRLLGKLNDQETQLDQWRQEQDGLRQQMEQKRTEFEAYIVSLNLDR